MVTNAGGILMAIGALLALAGGLFGFLAFPRIVDYQIAESFKLQKGSDAYERWETFRIPIVYKFYFFNVTNPDEVHKGAKPIVKEIGPYIYNQYKKKLNVTRKDDILSYYQYQRFEFDQKASAPLKDTDDITVLNLPLMSTATIAEYDAGTSSYRLDLLDSFIPSIFSKPKSVFVETNPRDFLFDGIYVMCNTSSFVESIICNIIESYAPKMMPRLEDGRFRFSLYGHKNGTHKDYFSINSGTTDISQLGEIVAWDESSTVNTWRKNSHCNEIYGTDSAIFPPFRTTKSVLNHFNADICRAVAITYSSNITFSGIDGYRYIVKGDTFASPSNNSKNECFCLGLTTGIKGNDGCLLDGVIELWKCQSVPALISMPHFYSAHEVYQNGVDGLKPNKSLHTMFIDLEPNTGTLLRGSKRAQVSMFIRPIERISITSNLPTVLMPVLWIDESFQLDDEYIGLLNRQLFDVLDILSIIKWSTTICGVLLFISGSICMLRSMLNRTGHTKLVPNY